MQITVRAHFGMLIWAAIVGLSFPAVGQMTQGLPPMLLTSIRFAVAALAISPLILRGKDRIPDVRGLVLYCAMGLSLAGFFGAMFWASHRTTALSMSTLYVSVPTIAYLLGRLAGVEKRAGALLSILVIGAIGAIGLAWAGSAGQIDQFQIGSGEVVFFLGCACSALYPVLSKWGLDHGWLSTNAALRTFWSLIIGSALIGFLGLTLEPTSKLSAITLTDALLVSYLGIFSSGVTFWLTQNATAVLTPATVTSYSYLVPFASMLLLFYTSPDQFGWQWLPGSVLVIASIMLLLLHDSKLRLSSIGAPQRSTHLELLRRP